MRAILSTVFGLLPLRAWLIVAAAILSLAGYAFWSHHLIAKGEAKCEAAQKLKQDKIDALQIEVNKAAAQKVVPLIARYESLDKAREEYAKAPVTHIAGCVFPAGIVHDINSAHVRER